MNKENTFEDIKLKKINQIRRSDGIDVAYINALKYITKNRITFSFIKRYDTALPSIIIYNNNEKIVVNSGMGRGKSYSIAKKIAILEYLERFISEQMSTTIPFVINSRCNLLNAIDPYQLILNKNTKYTDNLVIKWIEAESIQEQKKIWIPFDEVNYFSNNKIIWSTSSGVALAGSYTESLLFGILELIERDAFMNFWFYKTNFVHISLHSLDYKLRKKITLICKKYKTNVNIFLMKNNFSKLYSICVITSKKNKKGNSCGCSCDFDFNKAVENAFEESIVECTDKLIKGKPKNVIWHKKHSSEYISKIKLMSKTNFKYKKDELNVFDKLYYLKNRLNKMGLKILVVNFTTKELSNQNLFCTKSVIPGLIPISLNNKHLRIRNGALNRESHPFP